MIDKSHTNKMMLRIVMKTQPKELSSVSLAGVCFASPLAERMILLITKISRDSPTGTPIIIASAMAKSSIISPISLHVSA